jgi:ubiquinone/menaquinone biosynthesis C-methylase UbiE
MMKETIMPEDIELFCCPSCHDKLQYEHNQLLCKSCNEHALINGRLLDFRGLTPILPLHMSRTLDTIYDEAGEFEQDLDSGVRGEYTFDVLSRLDKKDIFLEIGGADGPMTPKIEENFLKVMTLDCSYNFLRRISNKTQKAVCLCGDAHYLPIQAATVDVVLCTEVLEHVLIPTQLLLEIQRVMKKDAILVLSVPNEFRLPFIQKQQNYQSICDAHLNFYTIDTLRFLMFRMGFKIISMETIKTMKSTSFRSTVSKMITSGLKGFQGEYIICVLAKQADPDFYWTSLRKKIKGEK